MGCHGTDQHYQPPFLEFKDITHNLKPCGSKTRIVEVWNRHLGQHIGHIRWLGSWRQYIFMALPDTAMSKSCNNEVNVQIDKMMAEWRETRRKARESGVK